MTRMTCCFCSGGTDDAPPGTYVEFAVRIPELDDRGTQWFGAHVSCFNNSTPPSYSIQLAELDESRQLGLAEHISVPPYRETKGIVSLEGGSVHLRESSGQISISADPAGLRDLARTLLLLADPTAPEHEVIRIKSGEIPLVESSSALVIARGKIEDFK